MDAYYTKTKPRVIDYNPLTHMAFYNQPSSPSPYPQLTTQQKLQLIPPIESSPKYPRSTSLAGKNIFSNSGTKFLSPTKPALNASMDSPRYYKTRPKNKIIDTLSGEIKNYNIQRPKLENLDHSYNKDKITNDLDLGAIKNFTLQKLNMKSVDNIAGSLKKPVPFVPYVDPFMLRKNSKN